MRLAPERGRTKNPCVFAKPEYPAGWITPRTWRLWAIESLRKNEIAAVAEIGCLKWIVVHGTRVHVFYPLAHFSCNNRRTESSSHPERV